MVEAIVGHVVWIEGTDAGVVSISVERRDSNVAFGDARRLRKRDRLVFRFRFVGTLRLRRLVVHLEVAHPGVVAVAIERRRRELVLRYGAAQKLRVVETLARLAQQEVVQDGAAFGRVRLALQRLFEVAAVDDVVERSSRDLRVEEVRDESADVDRSSQSHVADYLLQHLSISGSSIIIIVIIYLFHMPCKVKLFSGGVYRCVYRVRTHPLSGKHMYTFLYWVSELFIIIFINKLLYKAP